MSDITAIREQALRLAESGIYTFPAHVSIVEDRKKVRPCADWDTASTIDPERIATVWADASRWNALCVDCGKSGLVVLDPDGAEGVEAWTALDQPKTWRASTPGGGEHHYYRADPNNPVNIDNTGKVAEHVDVRGAGGFVIAPPSVDARGARVWLDGEPVWANLPLVPQLVIDRMGRPRSKSEPGPAADDDDTPFDSVSSSDPRPFTKAEANAYVQPLLERLRTAETGTINGKFGGAARGLYHFVPNLISKEQADAALLEALSHTEYDGKTWTAEHQMASAWANSREDWLAIRWDPSDPFGSAARGGTADGEPSSWLPVDMSGVADGTHEPIRATIGARSDGVPLLYPGREHSIASEPESGKTWLVCLVVAQELDADGRVLYIDFEDDEVAIGGRLLDLGVERTVLVDQGRFAYIRPSEGATNGEFQALVDTFRPTLVILDGVTEGYGLHGWDIEKNGDSPRWRQVFVKPALVAGAATLATDHVVKDPQARRGFAIGGQHKKAGLTGAAFQLDNVHPFGRGLKGVSALSITKDRPGGLRGFGKRSEGTRLMTLGDLVLDDRPESKTEGRVNLALHPPMEDGEGEGRPVEDTGTWANREALRLVVAVLTEHGPLSTKKLEQELGALDKPKNVTRDRLRSAIDRGVVNRLLIRVEVRGRGGPSVIYKLAEAPVEEAP